MIIKTLCDIAVTTVEQTVTVPAEKRWLIEKMVVSNLTNDADANKADCWLTVKLNDKPKHTKSKYAGDGLWSVPLPYVLESGQTIKLTAQANNILQVAFIGSEE
jgi:hypothetical protein